VILVCEICQIRTTRFEYPNYPVYDGEMRVENGFIHDSSRYKTTMRDDLTRRHKEMTFHFELNNALEGFDFKIRPLTTRYCVTFDIKENGILMKKLVHIGKNMFTVDYDASDNLQPVKQRI